MAAVGSGTVGGNSNSSSSERWYFTADELANSASRACGIDPEKELAQRQQTANLIQEMGQRLHVNQLCINTAIVYMHRFYRFHSFTKFNRNDISQCALFLAAKVEEQPRKLEHVIKCARAVLSKTSTALDPTSEEYLAMAGELVANENLMLQTLGFDIGIDHPHTHVVKCCQLVKATKELAQTSYFLATNTLHFTTMCLQYKPTVVACICIHVACKWTNWEIPTSTENRQWFTYIDGTVTMQLLEELSAEFLDCLDKCPEKMRNRVFSCLKSRETAPNSVHRTHLQPSPAQPQHLRADSNAVQRIDSSRNSGRTAHPTHQPDSTTLITDRRRTAPPSASQQQQQQQQHPLLPSQPQQQLTNSGHGHRSSGHHTNSSSERYSSYTKEHQRAPPNQNLTCNPSQGRHSLPSNIKPIQQVGGMVHPKKQYQQQHYLGGQQQQQASQQQLTTQQQTQAAAENKLRGSNNGAAQSHAHTTQHAPDQSRRPHMKQDVQQQQQHHHHHHQQQQHQHQPQTSQQQLPHIHHSSSMPLLNNQITPKTSDPKPLPIGRNQMIGGVLDESCGLLKPADFSQPYPSCASPPAHNPMFEGDSSSMENDFLSGIVTQTSPNNNSGSNSLGFGGTFGQQKQMSPPETQHRLSSPRAYSTGVEGLAGGLIPKKEHVALLPTSNPVVKQEVLPQQSAAAASSVVSSVMTKAQSSHPQLAKLDAISESNSIACDPHQQNQLPSHNQQQVPPPPPPPHQQQLAQPSSLNEAPVIPPVARGVPDTSKHLPNAVAKHNPLSPVSAEGLSLNPAAAATGVIGNDCSIARHATTVPDPVSTKIPAQLAMQQLPQALHSAHQEVDNSRPYNKSLEQTELDCGKKHKKKKEKKERKEKRHKEEKKKKKKKDKDREREMRSRSRSRSSSPVASSVTPVFQPIQMGGVKLKIKFIPPSKQVAASDSDSNAGNNGAVAGSSAGGGNDTNLKIKIPIDKFDSDRKDKRKRKEEFFEEMSTKHRKCH